MDKIPDLDIGRLAISAQRSRLVLRKPRQVRFDMVRQYVGEHYSEEGANEDVPVNLIAAYADIVGPKLVANNPRALLTTDNRKAKPVVEAMMSWVNKQIVKMNLVETLQRAVFDSLFSIGIVKVALADPGLASNMGWTIKAGEPFAEIVDLDDFVYDVHARRLDQSSYQGHRYRIPLKVANKLYGKNRGLSASTDQIYNLEGDERISLIGKTTLAGEEEFEEMVDLWEFFLPRHRVIVTLRDDDLLGAASEEGFANVKKKALEIKHWLGPDSGPYHFLCMKPAPGNSMPKAPLQNLFTLHLKINRQLNKLLDQAERQKSVVFVSGGADSDGNRLIDTADGMVTRVDNPQDLKAADWGGPNVENFQFMTAMKELYSWLAGNLDIMGGLSPQSKTAEQDKMLNENSSASIADMQQKAVAHAASIVKALCWYWHHDPRNVMKTTYSLPGSPQITAAQKIHPAGQGTNPATGKPQMSRDQSFDDMNITIDPYSLQYQSPSQRLSALNAVVTQIIAPMMQLLQQQGIAFDIQAYLAKVAKLGDIPDLIEIVKIAPPPQQEGVAPPSGGDVSPPPVSGTRTYNRISNGGATADGKQTAAGNAMRMNPAQNSQVNGVKKI